MLHNPAKYPDPEAYRPERWLEPGWPSYQEPLTQYPTIMGMSSFGWGQRTCLGQSVTRDETLVACGGLLWAFNMGKKQAPDGRWIEASTTKSNSLLIVKPDSFEMSFKPRNKSRAADIVANWEASDAEDRARREDFLREAARKRGQLATPQGPVGETWQVI
jgi:hypothetical protein